MKNKIIKSEVELQRQLNPDQSKVTRKRGTEKPFSSNYKSRTENGVYKFVCCGSKLFSYALADKVNLVPEGSLFTQRTEVHSSLSDAQLGHGFTDGPVPTHKRYCRNSVSLKLEKTT